MFVCTNVAFKHIWEQYFGLKAENFTVIQRKRQGCFYFPCEGEFKSFFSAITGFKAAFIRGVRRLKPVRPMSVPSWDLSVVLEGLVTAPFEPLESASDRILTLKVTLLLALTSLKRVGDLQAFSVSETCMDFAPGLVKVTLRLRPGYIPKVLSTLFRSQVVTLHSFHPPPFASSEDESGVCSARLGH